MPSKPEFEREITVGKRNSNNCYNSIINMTISTSSMQGLLT